MVVQRRDQGDSNLRGNPERRQACAGEVVGMDDVGTKAGDLRRTAVATPGSYVCRNRFFHCRRILTSWTARPSTRELPVDTLIPACVDAEDPHLVSRLAQPQCRVVKRYLGSTHKSRHEEIGDHQHAHASPLLRQRNNFDPVKPHLAHTLKHQAELDLLTLLEIERHVEIAVDWHR